MRTVRVVVVAGAFSLVGIACGLEFGGVVDGIARDGGAPDAEEDSGGDATTPECSKSEECQGFGNACYVRVECLGGRCDFQLRAPGAVATSATQIEGDCQRIACDGFGGFTLFTDNSDVPNDNNACTLDICADGTPHPFHPPANDGTFCGDGGVCKAGVCNLENDAGPDGGVDAGADASSEDAGVTDAGEDGSHDSAVDLDAESDAGADTGP